MPDLIRGLGNRARDPTPPQIGPVGAGTVGLVRQDTIRPSPGSPTISSGDPDPGQHRLELRRITTLTGGHQQRQRLLILLGRQMQLGRPTSPRPAQRVVGRFGLADPAWRFFLPFALDAAPAACWCARSIVESTLTSQVISRRRRPGSATPPGSTPTHRRAASAGTSQGPTRRPSRAPAEAARTADRLRRAAEAPLPGPRRRRAVLQQAQAVARRSRCGRTGPPATTTPAPASLRPSIGSPARSEVKTPETRTPEHVAWPWPACSTPRTSSDTHGTHACPAASLR